MPTSATKFSKGYEGTKKKKRAKKRSSSYAAAYGATKKQQANVTTKPPPSGRKRSGYTKPLGRTRQTFKPKGLPTPTPVLNYLHKVYSGASRNQPGASEARHIAKSEVIEPIVKQAKESLKTKPYKPTVRVPSSTERGAAEVLALGVVGGEAEKALQRGARAYTAESAAKAAKAAGEKVAEAARKAPGRAAKAAKEAPVRKAKRVISAPRRAKATIKRAPELKTPAGRKAAGKYAARSAKRHPVRTGYGAVVATPEGVLPGEATKRARGFLVGSTNAVVNHPGETLKTTARVLPAAITAPAALGASAVESAIHGTPEPFLKTASEQGKGVAHIAEEAFSGNPKRAEKAARKEGSLAFLTPLPALSKTKVGKAFVKEGRGVSSAFRRKLATTEKLPLKELRNRKIRHAPKGTPEYAFAITARHHARKSTAVAAERARNPRRVQASRARVTLEKAATKAEHQFPGSNVIHQFLAEHPLLTPDHVRATREWYAANRPKDKAALDALDWLEKHPEYLTSKERKAVDKALTENERTLPANEVGKGERARLMQMGDVLGIKRPEDMSPVSGFHDRAEAWAHAANLDKEVNRLRREGRAKLDQAKVLKGTERQAALQEGRGLYEQARRRHAETRDLVQQLSPFTRPGQSIDRSKRTAYSGEMLKQYKQQVEQGLAQRGYGRPIWTRHGNPRGEGIGTPFPTAAGNVEHMRAGNLSKAGELDRSLEGLVRGTIESTRHRAGNKEFGRWMPEQALTYKWDGKTKHNVPDSETFRAITGRKTKENPNGGQFDPKSVGRLPVREFQRAVEDPFMSPQQKMAELGKILDEAAADQIGKGAGHAPSVLLPREIIKEAKAQIAPTQGGVLNTTARASSRLLLGTNPAWEASQVFAEGIPLLISKPSLAWKFPLYQKFRREYAAKYPGDALAARATAGASPIRAGVNLQPHDIQQTYTPKLMADGAKGLTRGKSAKELLSFAKLESLGRFDIARQNEYRTLQYMAEADRRHLKTWHDSLTGLFDTEARLSKKFNTREELHRWLESREGKPAKRRIEDYVDNLQGNWTAFTRYEQRFAPAVLFYPFIRYSLRWPLWAFPKEHPIRATVAYTLGSANANQLEKLVGGPLDNPIAYAYPVFEGVNGPQVLPAGSRISPGQSNITEALASGNPANVLSSLNPLLGAGITATTGVEPFTGRQVKERGYAALQGLIELPRPASLRILPGGKSLAETVIPGKERSAVSKAFAQYDPLREWRSFAWPGIPQSGEQFKKSEQLSKALAKKNGKGHIPGPLDSSRVQEVLFGKNGKVDKKELRRLIKEIHGAERASDRVKRAEKPFFSDSGSWGDEQTEALRAIEDAWLTGPSGKRYEEEKNPFGLPTVDKGKLREQFGLPSSSTSDLRKLFGLE